MSSPKKSSPPKTASAVPIGDSMELRLIPEYNGETSPEEWIQKAELVCSLRGIARLEKVIPLRLTGGAFAVYQQMPDEDKPDAAKIKEALRRAFGIDKFVAYEQFVSRRLRTGESVEVYLADLKRLASSFGGMPNEALSCAFVAGLPESVRQTLRAGARMEEMDLHQIVARAGAVIVDDATSVCAAGTAKVGRPLRVCYECGQPNHIARNCLQRRSARPTQPNLRGTGERGTDRTADRRCYRCGDFGHTASTCQGNDGGKEHSAPVSFPANM